MRCRPAHPSGFCTQGQVSFSTRAASIASGGLPRPESTETWMTR